MFRINRLVFIYVCIILFLVVAVENVVRVVNRSEPDTAHF